MATNKCSIIFMILAMVATSGSAKTIMVGDDKGWVLDVDFQAWAKDKQFCVGDELVFKYPVGHHNVLPCDENDFQKCIVNASCHPLASGEDKIKLDCPGKKYFICGVGKHCLEKNLKLCIDVHDSQSPPTPEAPTPAPTTGKEILVGDDKGWTKNVDYQAWASGKEVCVGDKLVFQYPVGKHNVLIVNETSFEKCTIPPDTSLALISGYDIVTVETPGKECFICGLPKHCEMGMKLCVDVHPAHPPNAPNSPFPGTRKLASTKNFRLQLTTILS